MVLGCIRGRFVIQITAYPDMASCGVGLPLLICGWLLLYSKLAKYRECRADARSNDTGQFQMRYAKFST